MSECKVRSQNPLVPWREDGGPEPSTRRKVDLVEMGGRVGGDVRGGKGR